MGSHSVIPCSIPSNIAIHHSITAQSSCLFNQRLIMFQWLSQKYDVQLATTYSIQLKHSARKQHALCVTPP